MNIPITELEEMKRIVGNSNETVDNITKWIDILEQLMYIQTAVDIINKKYPFYKQF